VSNLLQERALSKSLLKRCDARYFDPPAHSNSSPQAYVAQPSPSTGVTSPSMAEWIVDSGASHQVTNDINSLSSFLPYDGMVALHIGNGTGMVIHHIGSLSFTISNFTFPLQDILYVSTFTTNLLSLSKLLIDNSILIEFTSSSCLIKDRATKTLLLQTKLINGLYTLLLPPSISPQSFLGTADLWHTRLGHPSPRVTLQVLHHHKLPCSSFKLSLCHDCSMSKCHKLPFSTSLHCTSSPLELVHSDV
jgi:GAG-pre-integrase domain